MDPILGQTRQVIIKLCIFKIYFNNILHSSLDLPSDQIKFLYALLISRIGDNFEEHTLNRWIN
jgi:hypothetical protein